MTASALLDASCLPRTFVRRRLRFGRFSGPPFAGIHAVVIALLRHRVSGALICLMGALGLVGWAMTFAP